MTLCIAALCKTDDESPALALCFDRQIETETAKAETGFKLASIGHSWRVLQAGPVHQSMELTDLYRTHFKEINAVDPSTFHHSVVLEDLKVPPRLLRRRMADGLTQDKFSVTYEDFLVHGKEWLDEDTHRQMLYEISTQVIESELILFGPGMLQFALYKFSREVWECGDFATIGCGATVAEPVLYQRQQNRINSVRETLYALYEAKKLAEVTPGVGEKTIMGVVLYESPDAIRWVSPQGEEFLADEFDQFGPKQYRENARPMDLYFYQRYAASSASNATSSETDQT
jgi:hypothetical protein